MSPQSSSQKPIVIIDPEEIMRSCKEEKDRRGYLRCLAAAARLVLDAACGELRKSFGDDYEMCRR